MITIKDIAAKSGYSIGTVSRVINNQANVSEKARIKIQNVIDELEFEPNSNAKNLKQRESNTILVLQKGNKNVFLGDLLVNVEAELREKEKETTITYLSEDANEVYEAARLCTVLKPEGIIFLGGELANFEKDFSKLKVPCTLLANINEKKEFKNLSCFATDDVSAGEFAVDYLIKQGHKNIGVIGGHKKAEKSHCAVKRLEGAKRAFAKNGIPFNEELNYFQSYFTFENGYEAAIRLLQKNPDITAIFAMSDTIAIGIIRALVDMKKRVPEDISIIGFDGIEYGKFYIPRLTTISQGIRDMVKDGVADLLERIENPSQVSQCKLIPFTFIKGESILSIKDDRR